MKVIPNRDFLLRGDSADGTKGVKAKAGVEIEVTDEEAKQFAGYFTDPNAKAKSPWGDPKKDAKPVEVGKVEEKK